MLSQEIINLLYDLGQLLPRPLETPYQHIGRLRKLPYAEYYRAIYKLRTRQAIKITGSRGDQFIELTKAGQLEALMHKATAYKPGGWGGKWRLIIFDIPK